MRCGYLRLVSGRTDIILRWDATLRNRRPDSTRCFPAVLQQTRVATVIDYWNNWTARWPTIQDLATASPDDVLSAWRGLGYYSRATRIHHAAQQVSQDPELNGLLPETAAELEKKVPGVGRYTAGAISSIVFGRAEAILDGNVARVLSRQLAFHADPKSKATTDFLWSAAQQLVEQVAGHSREDAARSEKPGFWNQALMELGATVCIPQQPKCDECPISGSCRAYAEGERIAVHRGELKAAQALHPQSPATAEQDASDIEDLCAMCKPLSASEEIVEEDGDSGDGESRHGMAGGTKRKAASKGQNGDATSAPATKKQAKQGSLLSHFSKKAGAHESRDSEDQEDRKPRSAASKSDSVATELVWTSREPLPAAALATIQSHVRQYPMKAVKTKVREEECVVCVVEGRPSRWDTPQWLLEQRPDKGLLASLWEFPTLTLPTSNDSTPKARKVEGTNFVCGSLLPGVDHSLIRCKGEVDSLTHVFSHLKLRMHIVRFEADLADDGGGAAGAEGVQSPTSRRKWCTEDEVEAESMGTGMRNCWALVRPKGITTPKKKGR